MKDGKSVITMGAWALLADLHEALVKHCDTENVETGNALVSARKIFERELLAHPEWFAVGVTSSKRCMVTKIFPFKGGESEHRCIRPAGHEADHDFGVKP